MAGGFIKMVYAQLGEEGKGLNPNEAVELWNEKGLGGGEQHGSKSISQPTIIKKTQEAFLQGSKDSFLDEVDENGGKTGSGIRGPYYEANATDADGNDYSIFWKIKDDFDPDSDDDEGHAADWKKPYMILDEDGKNVTNKTNIK